MKNTIITLASVATLAGAANAQVTLGGTTYSAYQYVSFASDADFLAGTNGTAGFQSNAADHFLRDSLITGGASYSALNSTSGASSVGNAAWAAGKVDQYSYNQATGSHEVRLSSAVLGANIYQYVSFTSDADFLAGTNGTAGYQSNAADRFLRDSVMAGGTSYFALGSNNGALYQGSSGLVGIATWAAGNIDQYSYNQTTGAHEVRIAAVPEPSSTALLGLGGLALILRRRK